MTYRQVRRAIVSNNLTDRITSMLRDDIVSGKYEPGRQLPAGKDLSAAFGVSITVVREALSRLKSDGLVASHQGKGVFVEDDAKARPFRLGTAEGAKSSLRHIFELRMGVEMLAATLATERRTAADLKAMLACLKQMEPNKNSFEQALASDIAFHLRIAQATQNPLIVSFMKFLQPHLYESISKARASSARKARTTLIAYKDHYAIYEAIAASDPRRARLAIRRVLERSLRRLENE
ncbi:MAG TPA: FadR/GntR family transcriptional regulator [Pseudolabrys sp.]|nr:FadR/GntR family transcriptional regulator [Pseudolabrys sp.]